jgi:hypothetical protein
VALIYFLVLITLVTAPLLLALKKPVLIFEYPFFMAFAFAAFILPQAYSLIRFPGAVQDTSVNAVLLMCCLCMAACLVGYQLAPSAAMIRWATRPINMQRLFRVGVIFVALSYAMTNVLSTTEVQYSETGGMTGVSTILLFFQTLQYPGFAICFFCALRKPSFAAIAASVIGILLPLRDALIGRRENTAILVLSIVMALFYERGKRPPQLAIASALIFSMLIIPATAEYRGYANENNWEGVRQMDLVENFKHFINEESVLELRNAAATIEATRDTGNYQFGKAYWNHLVFRFVPAQLLTPEFKQALMFDIFDIAKVSESETGIKFQRGTTITGMGDTFQQFGWLGCLFFVFMGVLYKGLWRASLPKDALFARLMYVMSLTSGMRAVTHWTLDFPPGLLYFMVFLGIAVFYARAPQPRVPKKNRRRDPVPLSANWNHAAFNHMPDSSANNLNPTQNLA